MRPIRLSLLPAILLGFSLHAQEICNNAIDDDGDGAIDLNDPECLCAGTLNDGIPSRIGNHSFEERVVVNGVACCPSSIVYANSPPWLNCATGWNQATYTTTDYMHACDFMPTTVVPQPMPAGEACVGIVSTDSYQENIARIVDWSTPLIADSAYTLQFWAAPTSISSTNAGTHGIGHYYESPTRLTLFGRTNAVPLPINGIKCMGSLPGWVELASVELATSSSWQPVRMDFTPGETIRMFALGGSCDLPADFVGTSRQQVVDGDTVQVGYTPYTMLDDLRLNASHLFVDGITRAGSLCTNDLVLTATLPDGATEGQWYRDGIALVGSTGHLLDVSTTTDDGGLYTFTCTGADGCFRSDRRVPLRPVFTATPDNGHAPLVVTFIATSTNDEVVWSFGDGTTAQGDTVTHTYDRPGTFTVSLEHEVDGCASITEVVSAITVESGTSMSNTDGATRIQLHPNPVTDLLRADPGTDYAYWHILNALGQVVQQGSVINGRIEVAAPTANGSYVLRLSGIKGTAIARFIKR